MVYEVLEAANGQEALDQLRARTDVRIVVLDMMMPVMDGTTFRLLQLAEPALASIPFILLTARVDCAHLANALGAVACFQKPFRPDDLVRSIVRFG